MEISFVYHFYVSRNAEDGITHFDGLYETSTPLVTQEAFEEFREFVAEKAGFEDAENFAIEGLSFLHEVTHNHANTGDNEVQPQ